MSVQAIAPTQGANALAPIVHVKDGEVFANSKDVADYFGKNHADVLRDIRNVSKSAGNGAASWFRPVKVETKVGFGSRWDPAYDMTRDGFTLLVMGYTGPKAAGFKVKYIEQFNAMEAKLRDQAPAIPDFSDPVQAARSWADEVEKKRIAEAKAKALEVTVAEQAPKVEGFDAFLDADGLMKSTTLAPTLGFRSAQALHKWANAQGIIKKDGNGWTIRAKYSNRGLGQRVHHEKDGKLLDAIWKWTTKGAEFLRQWREAEKVAA